MYMKRPMRVSANITSGFGQRFTYARLDEYFVRIPKGLRNGLIFYFMIFGVFANLLSLYIEPDLTTLKFFIALLRIAKSALLLLPILLAFKGVGILHPLLFPFLLSLARKIFQDPLFLVSPFITKGVGLRYSSAIQNIPSNLETLNILTELTAVLWLGFIYVGYFAFKAKGWRLKNLKVVPSKQRFQIMILLAMAILFGFLQTQGGLTAWISAWGDGGRRETFEDIGPIIRLIGILYIVPLAWFASRQNVAFKQPLFVLGAVIFLFNGYLASGSRSSVLDVIIAFLCVWMLVKNKIPTRTAFLAGAVFFLLFGLLGEIRKASTYLEGDFEWSNVDLGVENISEAASSEIAIRSSLDPDVVIIERVPKQVDYIYGKTYLAAIFFWVPRVIWPDKPHGAGYYTGREILEVGTGVPPSPQAEAYWNFGFIGVVLIALLNGMLLRLLSVLHIKNRFNKGWIIIFVVVITSSLSLNSLGVTELLQRLIFVIPILKLLRLL